MNRRRKARGASPRKRAAEANKHSFKRCPCGRRAFDTNKTARDHAKHLRGQNNFDSTQHYLVIEPCISYPYYHVHVRKVETNQ